MTGSDSVLPDANLWLALLSPKHRALRFARDWLRKHLEASLVFCRFTQMALLRHVTTAAIMIPNVLIQIAARKKYERLLARNDITFLGEPDGVKIRWRNHPQQNQAAAKLRTDAYLVSFAMSHGLQFVTFGQGLSRYTGAGMQILKAES